MIESRRLPGDPTELRLRISYDDDLLDTPQGDTLERWDVTILHRRRTRHRSLPAPWYMRHPGLLRNRRGMTPSGR
ncbi:hypothetical protein ACRAWF_29260 [Streptomyces sp. L7]